MFLSIVDLMLAGDAIHVLAYQIEDFLSVTTFCSVGLLPLQLPNKLLFEYEASVQEGLLIHHE